MEQTQVPAQPPVQSAFRSRRSYPSLHHVSLAPLNPRFLADEEGEEEAEVPDYFNHPHHNHQDSPDPPTARSYLASFSVPGTPGVLSHSHSRSGSRTRHHPRSKSSSRIHHASDPNLQARSASSPLHHHHNQQQQHQPHQTHHTNRSTRTRHPANHHQDTEWMLRAGIALASSTREEKGQSWLVKRQSSTSLVSDDHQLSLDFLNHNHYHHHHSWSYGGSPRHGRSGRSTPAAANSRSRRASRSRPSSRVASRADLAMTSLGMATTATSTAASSRRESRTADLLTSTSTSTSTSTQKIEEQQQQQQQQNRALIPDFVDERIRAEMASIQRDENAKFDEEEEIDDDLFSFTSDYPYLDSGDESDEIDEQELQRLTRERGFGLGSWIDRMVEWTLFGVEDWPLSFGGGGGGGTGNDGTVVESRTITIADHPPHPSADNVENDPSSTHVAVAATPSIGADDTDTISIAESEVLSVCEKPGDQGGWGDAGWLFRVVKRALS